MRDPKGAALRRRARTGLALFFLTGAAKVAGAQAFEADFSRWTDPPLVKTRFGVYQTPLISRERLLNSVALLGEIGVHDLRYELGWGKPDVLAHDQVAGTAAAPTIDFTLMDAFASRLAAQDVRPLFALTYCPNPLKSRPAGEWAAWKDLPRDLAAWQTLCRDFTSHFASVTPKPAYEAWNEPDMPDPTGKMFFSGGPAEYERLYASTAAGVRNGDPDAPVGGAAIAYDLRYFQPLLSKPLDFASIHAYDNWAAQVAHLRSALRERPQTPIFLTEYASFKEFSKTGPVSRHPAAARFFRDVKGMLAQPDLAKVYWAQWMDDSLGLLTGDGHRKALFNAFKIYAMLPADRCAVTPDGANGVNVLAASSETQAGVVLWNEADAQRTVSVRLRRLPFARGTLRVYRIDRYHASYGDDPASENLVPERQQTLSGFETSWTGTIPPQSVVYLKVSTNAGGGRPVPPARLGNVVRTHYWFPDRDAPAYADFDPRTGTARLGMGGRDAGVAQTGVVLDSPARRFTVQVKKAGPFAARDKNSLFGLRVDFAARTGGYGKSVLFHGGLYDPRRDQALPWGAGGATPHAVLRRNEMNTGRPFLVDLDRLAPPNWDRKRVLVSFLLQNAGAGSRARVVLAARAAVKP